LEVEPGNVYGDFEILDSTLILGNDTEWDTWWGGDSDWWDWFFGFWYWEQDDFRSCWEPSECTDPVAAAEEKARIGSNLTILKQVINMLVKADDLLASYAYSEAENATVVNSSYQDEYMYHLKWSKRYWYRGMDNDLKGRPHRAINDYKKAWQYSIIATKYAYKAPEDPEPGSNMENPCGDCPGQEDDCGVPECENVINQPPWWMIFYINYCNICHFENAKGGK
jgi:hypothetical protein